MIEPDKNGPRGKISRLVMIWAMFSVALAVMLLIADLMPSMRRPSYLQQALICGVGALLLLVLFFLLKLACSFACWPCRNRRNFGRTLIGLAIFATLVAIFYTEEDWRGKRAWEICKSEYEARGFVLDWDKLIPPLVPEDQNFFKAPKMTEWFVRKSGSMTNEFVDRLSFQSLLHFATNNPIVLAEWTWLPAMMNSTATNQENADLVLNYISSPSHPHTFREADVPPVADEKPDDGGVIIPLIQLEDVTITTAIKNLAQQADIIYMLDPKIGYGQPDKNGKIKPEPTLTIRWQGITARAALLALLDNYDLQLIVEPDTGIARITLKNSGGPQIYASPDLSHKIRLLLQNVIGTNIIGVRGDRLLTKSAAEIKPVRIILRSGINPAREIADWFSQCFPTNATGGGPPKIHVEPPVGTIPAPGSFRVILDSACSAADFVAWSDQARPDFDRIQEALKRPYARIDCDYSLPAKIGIPNFIAVRSMAQVLAERAQCHFLLNQPEQALDDLTRIHEMRLLLEGAPTHEPMTLVAAMINVAVTGAYTTAIGEGMQRQVWQEPQLVELQKQLAEKQLMPFVYEALQYEPVAVCRDAELVPIYKFLNWNATNYGVFTKAGGALWPRGWTYQNLVNITTLEQGLLKGFDPALNVISPGICDEAAHNVGDFFTHTPRSPYKFLAAIAIPNFTKAWQTTAYNQTMVNEAQTACALERYKLTNGNYPETIDALVPQFIEKIPHDVIGGQPLHYRRTNDGKFLLYSVGWNETDDGGIPGKDKSGNKDWTRGDWVWTN